MKYIVTIYNSEVYEVENEYTDLQGKHWYVALDGQVEVEDKEILKQADTIEELCDEFVILRGERKELVDMAWVHYYSKTTLSEYFLNEVKHEREMKKLLREKYEEIKLFGVIDWLDDKGNLHIKVIAKMNEKGELELL